MEFLNVAGKIGLIVRGKTSRNHSPGVMEQHADCMLSNGEPIGFFGDANGGMSNGIGMNMSGSVFRYERFLAARPFYVDFDEAKKYKLVSALLLVSVTDPQARLFTEYWTKLEKKPGEFDLLGDNCSTHASAGFIYCGLLKNGIPGLDTPDNLFRQISAATTTTAYYGYLGFKRKGGSFDVVYEPVDADAAASSGSSAPARSSQSQSSGLPSSLNSSNTGSRVSSNSSSSRR